MGTKAACTYDLKLALQTQPGTQGEQNLEEGKVAVIVAGPMLGTNVLSTFLIAWKAWCVGDKPPFSVSSPDRCSQGNTAESWARNSEGAAIPSVWRGFLRF